MAAAVKKVAARKAPAKKTAVKKAAAKSPAKKVAAKKSAPAPNLALPPVGKLAPDFTLQTDEDAPLKLFSLRGNVVVLLFYPKDDTPTCTEEACEFRDAFPDFRNIDAVILGISPDTVRKHVKFRKKFELPYNLLADIDHAVAEKYGVWGEKTFWGRKYMGVLRTTFVIDEQGKIAHVFDNVKAAGHAAELLDAVTALKHRKPKHA